MQEIHEIPDWETCKEKTERFLSKLPQGINIKKMSEVQTYLYIDRSKRPVQTFVLETYENDKKIRSTRYESDRAVAKYLSQNPCSLIADKLPPGVLTIEMSEDGKVVGYNDIVDPGILDDIVKQVADLRSDPSKENKTLEDRLPSEQS